MLCALSSRKPDHVISCSGPLAAMEGFGWRVGRDKNKQHEGDWDVPTVVGGRAVGHCRALLHGILAVFMRSIVSSCAVDCNKPYNFDMRSGDRGISNLRLLTIASCYFAAKPQTCLSLI